MNDVKSAAAVPRFSMRERMAMYNDNALKIGLFGANCSSGRAVTQGAGALDRQLGGQSGARPDGATRPASSSCCRSAAGRATAATPTTWARRSRPSPGRPGCWPHTKRLIVFGTVHAPLFHPIIAAKQIVTADHVGEGRFGLNIVVGWNEDEFEMFGVTQRDHEQRYDYAQEWLDAVKMAWGPQEDFDYDGQFIKLKNVRAKPKPYGGTRPLIMNAGASADRPRLRHPQLRRLLHPGRPHLDGRPPPPRCKAAKDEAAAQGKELDVYAVGVVTCRPTQKEAEEYYHYATIENGDWSAVDGILGKKNISVATVGEEEFQKQRHHYAHGMGGLLMVGDPDRIAQTLAASAAAPACAASASRSSIISTSCRTSATRCCRGSSAWASARSAGSIWRAAPLPHRRPG